MNKNSKQFIPENLVTRSYCIEIQAAVFFGLQVAISNGLQIAIHFLSVTGSYCTDLQTATSVNQSL